MAQTTSAQRSAGTAPIGLIIAAIGTVVFAGYVLMQLNTEGHAAFNTSNAGVSWGMAIVMYDYLLLISVGTTMVASLSTVLAQRDYDALARRCYWLALAALIGGVAVLMMELGYPLRSIYATLLNFQIASPLFWKVILIGVYLIALLVLTLGSADRSRPGAPLAIAAFALAVAIALAAGSVYGLVSFRPFWFGGGTIAGFLVEAVAGGLAAAMLVARFAGLSKRAEGTVLSGLGRLLLLALLIHLAIVGGRAVSGLYGTAEGLQAWQYIVSTPLFHIGLWGGIVLPIVLLALPTTRTQGNMQLLAGVLSLVGLLIHHYEFIIGGQVVPMFKGSWVPPVIDYAPSTTELALIGVGLFIVWLVYALGSLRAGGERA